MEGDDVGPIALQMAPQSAMVVSKFKSTFLFETEFALFHGYDISVSATISPNVWADGQTLTSLPLLVHVGLQK